MTAFERALEDDFAVHRIADLWQLGWDCAMYRWSRSQVACWAFRLEGTEHDALWAGYGSGLVDIERAKKRATEYAARVAGAHE